MCVQDAISVLVSIICDCYFLVTHSEMLGLMLKSKKINKIAFFHIVLRRTSLQLCARLSSSQTRLLGLCQLGALQCQGRSFTLASDSSCDWPDVTSMSCEDCQPGMICQGESARFFKKFIPFYFTLDFILIVFIILKISYFILISLSKFSEKKKT